jgi:hypothetical protein
MTQNRNMSIMLTRKELTFILYSIRPAAFENDLEGCQKQAEDLRKKLTEVCEHVPQSKSQQEVFVAGNQEAVSGVCLR